MNETWSNIICLNLRKCENPWNRKIKKPPNSICKLQSLQILGDVWSLRNNQVFILRNFIVTTKQKSSPNNLVGGSKSLSGMNICWCSNLISLPGDMGNHTTLQDLVISGWVQLDVETRVDQVFQFMSLQKLEIFDLPKIRDFPPKGLVGAADTLQELCIEYCHNLAALPEWLPNLRSLKKFMIKHCPELSYLPKCIQCLTSLTDLRIEVFHKLEERCVKVLKTGPKLLMLQTSWTNFFFFFLNLGIKKFY